MHWCSKSHISKEVEGLLCVEYKNIQRQSSRTLQTNFQEIEERNFSHGFLLTCVLRNSILEARMGGRDPRMAPPKTILHEASDNSARFRVYWCGKNHDPPRLRI